jgi:ribosomal protein S27AE
MPIASCSCGKSFNAHESLAGKRVICPSCGGVFLIPPSSDLQQRMNAITVSCLGCLHSFSASPHLAGTVQFCPRCGTAIELTDSRQIDQPPFAADPFFAYSPVQPPPHTPSFLTAPTRRRRFSIDWSQTGSGLLGACFTCLFVGRFIVKVFFPEIRDGGIPPAMYLVLIPIWATGIAGVVCLLLGKYVFKK